MNPRFLPLCFAICLVFSPAARAGFTIVNPPATSIADTQTILPPAVTMPSMTDQTTPNSPVMPGNGFGNMMMTPTATGMMASYPTVVSGFGHDIPLSIAVKQIVPANIRVNFDNTVDQSMLVNWHGGKPWREVLADALRPNSLSVSENANAVMISAARGGSFGQSAMMPASMSSISPQISTLAPVALPPIEIPNWTAKSTETLHQTLEAWCKKADVSLRWDSEFDYPIETNVNLQGDFETSVRTLLSGLKNANPRPVAHYYRSKPGVPGVLLVPSPSAENLHVDHGAPAQQPSLPAISNIN